MDVIHNYPRRSFNPEFSRRYGRPTFPMEKLVKYSPKYGRARLHNFPFIGSCWRPRMFSIVVSVDGPCKINNSNDPNSQGAWAVYFGRDNDEKNMFGLLPENVPQTNSRAELEGVYQALLKVQQMKSEGYFENPFNPFTEVIIRLTSQYVHDAFSKDVWIWQHNGWKTTKNNSIAHLALIIIIHNLICHLEMHMTMAVRFWRTERDTKAQALATQAFA